MDVKCERCNTEYEFDDALVSERGTTVRCTECGHQFKVRRAGTEKAVADAQNDGESGDRWTVQTALGQQLTFLTLRELQRAILAKRVVRRDMLLHGGSPPRPLGSIAELEPLFESRTSGQNPSTAAPPVERVITAPILLAAADAPPDSLKRTAPWGSELPPAVQPAGNPPRATDTLRPLARSEASPSPLNELTPSSSAGAFAPPTLWHPKAQGRAPVRAPEWQRGQARGPSPLPGHQDDAEEVRAPFHSSSDEAADGIPGRRRVGGWVVAVALLLSVGVAGWVVAKPYMLARAGGVASELDTRVEPSLKNGELALADGDLDRAQEQFDKASALTARDPRVLRDEARVAVARADIPWLKLRLLSPEASEEVRATKVQLDERVARARLAADAALAAAPDDPAALRSKIDALRMLGEQGTARTYVTKILGQTSQPDTAYVLAALDLAEAAPLWTTVLDRLRLAAGAEGNVGRARAALIYALMKSGKPGEAKSELAKLDGLALPYPLAPNLHAFVEREEPPFAIPSASNGRASQPTTSARREPPQRPAPLAAQTGGAASGAGGIPADSPSAMQAASRAIHRGDWNRAKQIYEAVVARNPNDSEALAGIGDVARAQGDLSHRDRRL